MTLDELGLGKDAIVSSVDCERKALRQHIFDMGLTPGTEVTMVKAAPMGDPLEIRLRDYELTLRKADAAQISIQDSHETDVPQRINPMTGRTPHPELGEGGHVGENNEQRYHWRPQGTPMPKGAALSFALAGNQNCGKTTLFNQLTGSNQHVGNFPGVTVDRKDGQMRNHPEATVTDLPGIYSLSPYTGEEVVSRQFIFEEKPDAIIDIVDATNIERNLYLTLQLMELDAPMVIALNMMDEVAANGGSIDINEMETLLGVPVVPISAVKNQGVGELAEHAIHVARHHDRPGRMDFCRKDGPDGGALHRCIHAVMHLIDDHAQRAEIPLRFAATKLVEGDQLVEQALSLDSNEQKAVEHIVSQMETESGQDRMAALADMRFSFINDVCSRSVTKVHESREHARSVAMDRILTGRHTAIPAFALIMGLVFWLTFSVIGQRLSDLLAVGVDTFTAFCDQALTHFGTNEVIHSLVINGVFAGVGTVISFLPIIVTLFLLLSLLEDSGYMARIAFVMDKALRKVGLSGRSIVPMLVGFGCTVPAVMATRTLPSEHDRKMTIMLTPFMSCSAKLPIYALLCAMFFPRHAAIAMICLYLLGILVGIVVAKILQQTTFHSQPVPFVMELPNYRFPSLKTTVRLAWDKTKGFLTRAFSIIFIASITVWFLQTFDVRINMVADQSQSMLATLGSLVTPIFTPLGFSDWRASTALITGLLAKESVVSTLTVLLGGQMSTLTTMFTPFSAFVFLTFTLLYPPCVAAISSVRAELGGKWALAVFAQQLIIAWLVSWIVRLIGVALGFS